MRATKAPLRDANLTRIGDGIKPQPGFWISSNNRHTPGGRWCNRSKKSHAAARFLGPIGYMTLIVFADAPAPPKLERPLAEKYSSCDYLLMPTWMGRVGLSDSLKSCF